jgi:hypothetical protein
MYQKRAKEGLLWASNKRGPKRPKRAKERGQRATKRAKKRQKEAKRSELKELSAKERQDEDTVLKSASRPKSQER